MKCSWYILLFPAVLGIEPNFDVPIVNVTVVAGQTAVLPCSIEDLGRYKVRNCDDNSNIGHCYSL